MFLKKKHKRILAVVLSMAIVLSGIVISPSQKGISLGQEVQAATAFEQQWNNQPYASNQTRVVSYNNGILKLESTGSDPWLKMYNIGTFDPNTYRYIEVRYRVAAGASTGYQIYYLTENDSVPNENKVVYGDSVLIADGL